MKLSNFFPKFSAHVYKFISYSATTELGGSLNCIRNFKVKNQVVATISRFGYMTYDFQEEFAWEGINFFSQARLWYHFLLGTVQ